jgi:GAF domain
MQASFENTVRSREGADKSSLARLPLESGGRFPALRLVVIYAFFGALWILLSDRLLSYLVPDLQLAERLQTYKGWFFVAVTSVLLWLLAKRFLSQVRAAEEALHRLNRKFHAIRNCNQMLLRATDEQSLLEEICRIVCEETGYRMAWVGYAEHDEAKSVRPVAWTGTEEGYLANLATWADTERGSGPTGTAIRSGESCCIQDFATDPRLEAWRQSVLQHGCLASTTFSGRIASFKNVTEALIVVGVPAPKSGGSLAPTTDRAGYRQAVR